MLPDIFTLWNTDDGPTSYGNQDRGIQFQDINGDGLVDVMQGFGQVPSTNVMCIWLNTGCGWVPQANYTGIISSCLPSTLVDVGGIEFDFAGMTVSQFVSDIARELLVKREEVTIVSAAGKKQSGSVTMDKLATRSGGFVVSVFEAGSSKWQTIFARH